MSLPFMTSSGYIVRPHFRVGRKGERSDRKQSKEGLRREKEKIRGMGRRLGRGEREKINSTVGSIVLTFIGQKSHEILWIVGENKTYEK